MWLCNSCTFATRPIKVLFSYFKTSLAGLCLNSSWVDLYSHLNNRKQVEHFVSSNEISSEQCNSKRNCWLFQVLFMRLVVFFGPISKRVNVFLWCDSIGGGLVIAYLTFQTWVTISQLRTTGRANREKQKKAKVREKWSRWNFVSKPRQMCWRARHISPVRQVCQQAHKASSCPTCATLHTFAPCAVYFAGAPSYATRLTYALLSPTVNTAELNNGWSKRDVTCVRLPNFPKWRYEHMYVSICVHT